MFAWIRGYKIHVMEIVEDQIHLFLEFHPSIRNLRENRKQSFNRADQRYSGNEDSMISDFRRTEACGPRHTPLGWGGCMQFDLCNSRYPDGLKLPMVEAPNDSYSAIDVNGRVWPYKCFQL